MNLLRLLSRLVPAHRRREWLAEWTGELQRPGSGEPGSPRTLRLDTATIAAAGEDAIRLRLREIRPARIATDIRFGVRLLARKPLFTAVATTTLALGIGANTAIFSIVEAVLLRDLDYPNAARLVGLRAVDGEAEYSQVSLPNFRDYAERIGTLEGLNFATFWSPVYDSGEARRIAGIAVSSGYFDLFGAAPALGRYLRPEEDVPGGAAAIVISHGFWQDELGGDPEAVGRELILDGAPHVIVGVARPGLEDPRWGRTAVWRSPPVYLEQAARDQSWLIAHARLAPDVTLERAQQEFDALSAALASEYPDTNRELTVRLVPLHEQLVGDVRPAILVLLGAVMLVLLIACANVANLLLARGAARDREIAIRVSLGAGRGRIACQLITESLVLALAGGFVGLWIGWFAARGFEALGSPGLPHWARVSLDPAVLGFTAGVAVATGLLFGIAPLRQLGRTDINGVLRGSTNATSAGASSRRLRSGLAVAEIAVSTVLLVAAVLMLRSFIQLSSVDLGLDPEGVLTLMVTPADRGLGDPVERAVYYQSLREQVAATPGVSAVAQENMLALGGGASYYTFRRDDRPPPRAGDEPLAEARVISADYFDTLRIPLIEGRGPEASDRWETRPVAFVNETLVREIYPDGSPLGKHLTIHDTSHEIVGVVGDLRAQGPAEPVSPFVYTLHEQSGAPPWMRSVAYLVIRTDGDPLAIVDPVRRAIREVDSQASLDAIAPYPQLLDRYHAAPRFQAGLLGALAALATVLACIGVAGVMSYNVALRVQEIGIRRALGAGAGDVLHLVAAEVGRLTAMGLIAGAALALATTRLMAAVLFEVAPTDAISFAVVSGMLLLVAAIAGLVPAVRAIGIDPVRALRSS